MDNMNAATETLQRRMALLGRLVTNGAALDASWDELMYWTARNAAHVARLQRFAATLALPYWD